MEDFTQELLELFDETFVVYDDCKIYKIYHKDEDRDYACIIFPDGKRTTITWAKYVMSRHLNRILRSDEEVDHRDENKRNDSVENLQILTRLENTRKSAKGETIYTLTCPVCGIRFERTAQRTNHNHSQCCSRECGYIKIRKE